MFEPSHGKRTVIAYANIKGSGEHAHSRSLTRTTDVRSRKRQAKRKLQAKN